MFVVLNEIYEFKYINISFDTTLKYLCAFKCIVDHPNKLFYLLMKYF